MKQDNIIKSIRVDNGLPMIGRFDLGKIGAKVGSPFYIYSAEVLRNRYRYLADKLPDDIKIHYSLKANPLRAISEIFAGEGAGAEVASEGELVTALKSGFSPDNIIFAGPCKSDKELQLAISKKIGIINVESRGELVRIAGFTKKGETTKIALRINFDLGSTGSKIAMNGGPQKFGFDDSMASQIVKLTQKLPTIKFCGFHFFPGTQIENSRKLCSIYNMFAKWVLNFAKKENIEISELDFGGGLGIPFADKKTELDVAKIGICLHKIGDKLRADRRFEKLVIRLEPGRYLAGPAGMYVSKIGDIKTSRGETFIITDGGIHHALIPIVMNKNYPSHILGKIGSPRRTKCNIAGPLCSAADVMTRSVTIEKPEVGDLLAIFNSGAYGYSAGMIFFLSHPTPAEVMIDGDLLFVLRPSSKVSHGGKKEILITPSRGV